MISSVQVPQVARFVAFRRTKTTSPGGLDCCTSPVLVFGPTALFLTSGLESTDGGVSGRLTGMLAGLGDSGGRGTVRLKKNAERELLSPSVADPYDRPAPVFVGFGEGQVASIGALYEFNTASGEYVYLSEMECVDIQYRPFSRQLALTFECVSSELMPESVAVLTFDDAEIYSWQTSFEGCEATSGEPRIGNPSASRSSRSSRSAA